MPNYTSAIEEIKSRCNIVDVISTVVPLKRGGDTYKACCPFHKEKTPSFVVSEKKQFYHCFGCGESGDVFSFVEKYYNVTFPQAVEKLAAQYGIEIVQESTAESRKRAQMLEVNRMAAKYFYDNIKKTNNPGYKYISSRGISNETISKFGLGYAEDGWSGLTDYLTSKKVPKDILVQLGLASQKGNRVYDKYRNRLMFPIIDTRSKVIGFGGRIIGEGEPKYLNSSESYVFLKKNNLFGLDKAKDSISEEGYAFLVEGYMDMVSLYQSGIHNVVASLGTALTENQAKLLHRYCGKVILCYDADAAGVKAALRGIDVLRKAEMEVRVLHVDDGKDPDEYVKKNGKEAFLNLAKEKSLSDVDYKVALIGRKYNYKDKNQSIKFLKAVAEVLRELSPVECEVHTKELASRFGISEEALRNEVSFGKKKTEGAVQNKEDEAKSESVLKSDLNLEQMIIRLSMIKSDYFNSFAKYDFAFVSDNGMSIGKTLAGLYKDGEDFDPDKLKDYLNEAEYNYLIQIKNDLPVGDPEKAFNDCIDKLEGKKKKRRESELRTAMQMLDDLPHDEENEKNYAKLVKELQELRKNKKG